MQIIEINVHDKPIIVTGIFVRLEITVASDNAFVWESRSCLISKRT